MYIGIFISHTNTPKKMLPQFTQLSTYSYSVFFLHIKCITLTELMLERKKTYDKHIHKKGESKQPMSGEGDLSCQLSLSHHQLFSPKKLLFYSRPDQTTTHTHTTACAISIHSCLLTCIAYLAYKSISFSVQVQKERKEKREKNSPRLIMSCYVKKSIRAENLRRRVIFYRLTFFLQETIKR